MDRGPDGAGSHTPGARGSRRLLAAGLAVVVVILLGVIAVLATRLAGPPPAAKAAAAGPTPASATSLTVPGIYQRVAPSVVTVQARELGTGVIVADSGTILTADHVVAGGRSITVTFADGTVANATVISADKKMDIAVLSPAKLPQVVGPATLGGSAGIGAAVVAIGNPLGLTESVTSGVISGLDRTANTDRGRHSGLIQFDAAVNPGSSGGPLLDSRGMVIGIVVALAAPDGRDAFAGIAFAVPIGTALGGGSGGGGPGKGPQI